MEPMSLLRGRAAAAPSVFRRRPAFPSSLPLALAACSILLMAHAAHGNPALVGRVEELEQLLQTQRTSKFNVSLVITVTTVAKNSGRRAWQRAQFAKSMERLERAMPRAASSVIFKFVIGKVGLEPSLLQLVEEENKTFGDLLLLDIIDSNHPDPPPDDGDTATALKVAYSAMWAYQNYDFPFFLRLGDDSYFRADYFLTQVASTLPTSKLLLGNCRHQHVFPNRVFVGVYCSGMGFLMTQDVVEFIGKNRGFLNMGYPEDAMVALWLAGTRVKVQNDGRFVDYGWHKCGNQTLVVHKHPYGDVDDDGIMKACFPLVAPK